jgi:HAD superfamily hydrolase (TIGR01509 family)
MSEHVVQTRAALWDMDGTLIDSGEEHWDSWVEVFTEEGFTITRADFNALFGRRNTDVLNNYLGTCPPEHMLRMSQLKESRYRDNVRRRGATMMPGARALVERLAASGWRQAIATAAPRANAEAVLEALGIGHRFGAIIASEDVAVGKPDPSVFLVAAERLGATPDRSIVLEDAPAGIEAARRAGMKSIGICTLHPSLKADIPVRSLDELPAEFFETLVPA